MNDKDTAYILDDRGLLTQRTRLLQLHPQHSPLAAAPTREMLASWAIGALALLPHASAFRLTLAPRNVSAKAAVSGHGTCADETYTCTLKRRRCTRVRSVDIDSSHSPGRRGAQPSSTAPFLPRQHMQVLKTQGETHAFIKCIYAAGRYAYA
jgi:hypothetical protein